MFIIILIEVSFLTNKIAPTNELLLVGLFDYFTTVLGVP
jgi:hypothetical protein